MLVSLNEFGQRLIAENTTKKDGPFICPGCGNETVVKKGKIKTHHFAHKVKQSCWYGVGESDEHRRIKMEIYHALKKCAKFCELEFSILDQRPDIVFSTDKHMVAVEVQRSNLSVEEIDRRTSGYAEKGLSVIWILTGFKWDKGEIRVNAWEKRLHALYYGRVYLHQGHEFVSPYHFNESKKWIPPEEYYIPNGGGETAIGGGYWKYYKNKRTPLGKMGILSIFDDFHSVKRKAQTGKYQTPKVNLWIDKYDKWWD